MTRDLFGDQLAEMAAAPMRGKRKRRDPRPNGYAALPGTGPAGETCGSCRHLVRVQFAKAYPKCELSRARWTGGRATDVLVRSPACKRWEPETTTDREAPM